MQTSVMPTTLDLLGGLVKTRAYIRPTVTDHNSFCAMFIPEGTVSYGSHVIHIVSHDSHLRSHDSHLRSHAS